MRALAPSLLKGDVGGEGAAGESARGGDRGGCGSEGEGDTGACTTTAGAVNESAIKLRLSATAKSACRLVPFASDWAMAVLLVRVLPAGERTLTAAVSSSSKTDATEKFAEVAPCMPLLASSTT